VYVVSAGGVSSVTGRYHSNSLKVNSQNADSQAKNYKH
jgi:hypothetical protein